MRFETKAIHVGQPPDPSTGATVLPIHLSSTFTQEAPCVHKGFDYSRSGNPTRKALEECLAALEEGAAAAAFASGLAAETAILSQLQPGDRVVTTPHVYGGTYRLLEKIFRPWGLEVEYVPDVSINAFQTHLKNGAKLVWVETPTNPMLSIIDLAELAKVAHGANALLVVDNTFASPYFQRPIALGADFVIHSTTKYLGGHSDVVGGAVITARSKLMEGIRFYQNAAGAVPGPFECWLTLRGMKTLGIRMERHQSNALEIATRLLKHPKVERVVYPGLDCHPGYLVAKRQMSGFSGMVSVVLRGNSQDATKVLKRLKVFSLAESLGGVESLAELPALMTHASIPAKVRNDLGIVDGLIRLSIGIEHVEDLWEDLKQALE